MTLVDSVQAVFAPDGLLAQKLAHFQPRAGQTEMALAVAQAVQEGGELVVEAGTGVGKTFSYLVPALLSGERVLVSTATKTLQDQLFGRDLPRLADALGLPVRMALLKGRGSYLCTHRLQLARHDGLAHDRQVQRVLSKVEEWSHSTRSGDLAELAGLDERSPVIPLVTSTRDNCLGSQCPSFRQCHVQQARREALAADVVVINHHLFFADMAVRESGVAELLPTVRVVIFDEAHQLNTTGVQFLGSQLSTRQLLDFSRDMLSVGLQHARGLVDWLALAAQCERATQDLATTASSGRPGARLAWTNAAPKNLDAAAWQQDLQRLSQVFRDALAGVDQVSDCAPDFARLHERCVALLEKLQHFAQPCTADVVRWLEPGLHARMVESPLDIGQALRERLPSASHSPPSPAVPPPEHRQVSAARTWVFTSATLGTEETLRWFTEPCGLQGARVLRVQSPFDYATQAALYVPAHLPHPADPAHSTQVAQWAGDAVARLGGRTLVLTTTLRALRVIGEALQARFAADAEVEVLVQGEQPKRRLMERFRAGTADGRAGCVLVASASFWEGFDVPGDALQLVIIDKLPFPPPGDPVVDARTQRLEQAGRSAFKDFALPEAAVALKQGAGRLIRSESDRGILVVGDIRLATMGYGKRLLATLPAMRRLHSEDEWIAALDALTTPSTTGQTGF